MTETVHKLRIEGFLPYFLIYYYRTEKNANCFLVMLLRVQLKLDIIVNNVKLLS